jgi:hypothetical protein
MPDGSTPGMVQREGLRHDAQPAFNAIDPTTGAAVDPALGTFSYQVPGANGAAPRSIRLGFSSQESLQAFLNGDAAARARYVQGLQQSQQSPQSQQAQPGTQPKVR